MDDLEVIHRYLIAFIVTIASSLGFFIKRVITRVDKVEQELHEHKVADVTKYATKEEVKDLSKDIKEYLSEIITPINRKLESIEGHIRRPAENTHRES